MVRRAAISVLVLLLAGCVAPPPGPTTAPPPAARRPIAVTQDEYQREQLRLQRVAEQRAREYQRRVDRVGRRLLETMPNAPEVQFVIEIGNREVNAGATFGQVGVTSGILDFLRDDDELAAVLGHELAHISEGHVTKGMIGSIALSVLAIVIESQAPGLGNTAGGIGQLFLNRYTQGQEREADDVGLRIAYNAGFDPSAGAAVQERLAVEVPQTMTAGYFDTHPSSIERMITTRKLAEELLAGGEPPGRDEVLARARADRAASERRGTASADRGREEPSGQAAYRRRDEGRDAPSPDLGSEDCRRAETYSDRGDDSDDPVEREQLYRRAIGFCSGLAEAHAGLAEVMREQGRREEAEQEARRALELDPQNRRAKDALRR